jgi:UDP-N-acetylglucosamine--N-acetylmuramyl-(pentapeptide) pyrophosphoryl-undecaprenol N-acetylglucosamine transferase
MVPARRSKSGKTRVLVASTGGHLAEMLALAPRLVPTSAEELWVTFDSDQSRSLLAGRCVKFIRDTPPRDWRAVLANVGAARKILGEYDVGSVVSTGAGIALSFLPLSQLKGIPAHYIESCARVDGGSLTGRALERLGGVQLYTQHESLATTRWRFSGSVFDSYERVAIENPRPLRKVLVTVGTLPFPFSRLFARLQAILPPEVEVLIQSGVGGLTVDWATAQMRPMMRPEELSSAMENADAVVAHSGIGSLLMAFDAGKLPVLVPRTLRHKEHVDDHQVNIAQAFTEEGRAVMADAATMTLAHLTDAARWVVRRSPTPRPFGLL